MCRNGRYTERGIKELDGYGSERWTAEAAYAIRLDPPAERRHAAGTPRPSSRRRGSSSSASGNAPGSSHGGRRSPGRARSGCSARCRACSAASNPGVGSLVFDAMAGTGAYGGVDGLPGGDGSFLACSFWLADALHATGRTSEARGLFEQLLGLRNDVGLLSEEYDTDAGRQVGNTPQAFSMVGLVNTARQLSGSETGTNAPGKIQRP
ncbi:glycoside hydrolase family 15 protein [Amycolatopsis sp. NPDC024027]|uniref:glycoside hydrolase family 15 protein n=1 Tax=Amycolatopsis sp. NPDC024027 TaxID=3154327 RepID=UPI0033FB9EED